MKNILPQIALNNESGHFFLSLELGSLSPLETSLFNFTTGRNVKKNEICQLLNLVFNFAFLSFVLKCLPDYSSKDSKSNIIPRIL